MVSAGVSLTGSLHQGVSWFCCALSDQVLPAPSAEARKPNCALAITLTHGAGVHCPWSSITTYSRVSAENPPTPLKYSSGGAAGAAVSPGASAIRRGRGDGTAS